MQKFRRFSYTIGLILIGLLLLTPTISAKFFRANLAEFVKSEGQITIPIFSPAEKIEIRPEIDTKLAAGEQEDFILKAGEKYFISQQEIQIQKNDVEKERSGWGIQLMASSTEDKAISYRKEAASKIEAELIIIEENRLFKVIAGLYPERDQAEELQQILEAEGYNGWPREVEITERPEQKSESASIKMTERNTDSDNQDLSLYNENGEKLREAYTFNIEGEFEANSKKVMGSYQFGPLANSVLFSYKSDIEELTAHLLQNYFDPGVPEEALKAQAVIYRTSILYQLEIQGARLENLNHLDFSSLSPVFREAAASTKSEVLVKDEGFYYNHDFSLRKINKPKAGTAALAQARYSYREIISYYYERSMIRSLNQIIDSEEKFTARIAQGLELKEIRQITWSGPRVLTVIDYNLDDQRLKLKPVLAQGVVPGREDLANLIKEHQALAGVNGGYFHHSGRPLGLLYIDEELVSEPLYNRSSILIDSENNVSFAQVDWRGELLVDSLDYKMDLDGVNREVKQGETILFNYFYGPRMPALNDQHYDLVVRDEKILGIESKTGVQTAIPPDGFVLRFSAENSKIKNMIPQLKNKEVTLKYNFNPDLSEKNIIHGVGGGPRLLKAGEIEINGGEENFQNDILHGRAPRTAVALTEDNHLLLLTIDGRQNDLSVGMTLEELAQTLKDLGAVEAVNLDGGGSARMVIRGFTMSNPSEKRLISNGVIVDEREN